MKLQAYSVYDVVASVYSHPFYTVNDAVAVRDFTSAALDPQSKLYANPADFRLCKIGEFDDSVGMLLPLDQPQVLVSADAVINFRSQPKE